MINIENLRKLSTFLKTVPQEKFDMEWFRIDGEGSCNFISRHNCGTSGCALGWAPLVPGLEDVREDYYSTLNTPAVLKFYRYCKRVFNLDNNNEIWLYLFSDSWTNFDNTPIGAANRIDTICNEIEKHGEAGIEIYEGFSIQDEPYHLLIK